MCLTIYLQRTSKGLVQERSIPVQPVPAIQTPSIAPSVAKKEIPTEVLSNAESLSPSIPSPSSDNKNQGLGTSAQAKTKTSADQAGLKRVGKQAPNASPTPQHENTSNSQQGFQEHQSAPAKDTGKTEKITPSGHDAPPHLKKRVSFSDTLTRGRGKDYSPPAGKKAVQFITPPVPGEGAEHNNFRPKNSENSLVRRHSTGTPRYPRSNSHTFSQQETASNPRQSGSTQHSDSDNMSVKGQRGKHDAPVEFDLDSDSDASFTDIVTTARESVDVRQPLHRHPDISAHPRPKHETGSARLSSPLLGTAPQETTGFQSEIGDNESYVDRLTSTNTRKNYPYFDVPEVKFLRLPKRPDAEKAPFLNRYGHRLRAASDSTAALANSVRRSWPSPVFVLRTKSGNEGPSRTGPMFVLRDGQAFTEPNRTGLREQANKRQYQPPSAIDDDEIDDAIHYDPVRRQTYRNV
ncbi:MAG: hypothetical protein Q9222_000331 [Ikaeria aurantiellina]